MNEISIDPYLQADVNLPRLLCGSCDTYPPNIRYGLDYIYERGSLLILGGKDKILLGPLMSRAPRN